MRTVQKLSWSAFLALFSPKVHDRIAAARANAIGVAALQCEVLDSSRCGIVSALAYGPNNTFHSLQQMTDLPGGVYITGLPSSASFPFAYTEEAPHA